MSQFSKLNPMQRLFRDTSIAILASLHAQPKSNLDPDKMVDIAITGATALINRLDEEFENGAFGHYTGLDEETGREL